MLVARSLLLAVVLLAALAPPAGAGPWRWPARGAVLTPFALPANPFAAGGHRGIDIAAPAGADVRSACSGRVRFAGRVPGRGRAVTVACGGLLATHLELGRTAVRRGDTVAAGTRIGAVAASHVQLGARRAGRRHGYVDPLDLLGPEPAAPLGPAPPPRAPRALPPPTPRPAPAPAPAPAAGRDRLRLPASVWFGLGALACAVPLGPLAWRRGRRRRSPGWAVARR